MDAAECISDRVKLKKNMTNEIQAVKYHTIKVRVWVRERERVLMAIFPIRTYFIPNQPLTLFTLGGNCCLCCCFCGCFISSSCVFVVDIWRFWVGKSHVFALIAPNPEIRLEYRIAYIFAVAESQIAFE